MDADIVLFHRPKQLSTIPGLLAVESTRHGGVSEHPYQSLNLGFNTGDSPAKVRLNRSRFFSAIGIPESKVAGSHQVHGDEVLLVDSPGQYEGYDALITDRPKLYVSVSVADCVPILLYDTVHKAVAAIHAGWRGTVAQIVRKTYEQMLDHFGSRPSDCLAYIGTCIDASTFEVGEEVARQFDDSLKSWNIDKQKYLIDLKKANFQQLYNMGFEPSQIEVSRYSTVLDNENFFSYRKERGRTGRMLALIGRNS